MTLTTLACVLCVALLSALPPGAIAQSDSTTVFPRAIGFTDPGDTSDLMDYRLPDWTWYTWDVRFNMGASGTRLEEQDNDRWNSALFSSYNRFHESEDHQWDVYASIAGRAAGSSQTSEDPDSSGDTEVSDRAVNAALGLGGSSLTYLTRVFGVRLGGSVAADYNERRREGNTTPESQDVHRGLSGTVSPGFSVGRIRNVDPLLRSQRVSERLVAIGRPPLDAQELRALAGRIAQEGGYDQVFDRSQKYFWADLLEEFAVGADLSGRELLYLLEVFDEAYGLRFQGLRLDADFEVGRIAGSGTSGGSGINRARPVIEASWFHNFSLEQQIHLSARGSYLAGRNDSGERSDYRDVVLKLGHLMMLTDRWRWENRLTGVHTGQQSTDGGEWRYQSRALLNSNLVVFIEDRLALVPGIGISHTSYEGDPDRPEHWEWNATLTLRYQLGQGIY